MKFIWFVLSPPVQLDRVSKYLYFWVGKGEVGNAAIMGGFVWAILSSVILNTFISPPLWLLGLRKALLEAAKNSSPVRIDGVTALLWHVMRGTYTKLHSRAGKVMKFLLSKSVLTTVDDKFPDGQITFVNDMYYCSLHACYIAFLLPFILYVIFYWPPHYLLSLTEQYAFIID